MRTVPASKSAALALAIASLAATAALTAGGPARAGATQTAVASSSAICTAPAKHASLAARLSEDIAAAIRGRSGHVAIRIEDVRTGVECRYNEGHRSHSASVVKATILAALPYWRPRFHTLLPNS